MKKLSMGALLTMLAMGAGAGNVEAQEINARANREIQNTQTQQDVFQQDRTTDARPQQGQQDQTLVHLLAGKLSLANNCEVQMAKIALEQSDNNQVKQYAQKLVQDHQQLNQRLARLAPEVAKLQNTETSENSVFNNRSDQGNVSDGAINQRQDATPESRLRVSQANQNGVNQNDANQGDWAMQDNGLEQKIMKLAQDASKIKLEMGRKMLSEHKGQDFNMAFIGGQIASHSMMVAELQAVKANNIGDQNFQQLVQQAEETTRQHLDQAMQLAHRFEDDRTGQSTRDTANRPQRGENLPR